MNTIARFVLLIGLLATTYTQADEPNNPGFDIINKSGKPITIRLVNGDMPAIKKVVVQPATIVLKKTVYANNQSANIDTSKPTLLIVYEGTISNPESEMISMSPNEQGVGTPKFFHNWYFHPKANHIFHFKPNKTIYVTYDQDGGLRPQTGRSGQTEAGHPLNNNVSKDDIILPQKGQH